MIVASALVRWLMFLPFRGRVRPSVRQRLWPGRSDDVEFGRHSLIPKCCILYYCEVWPYLSWKEYAARVRLTEKRWTYVPCEVCLASGHVVEVHWCDPLESECRKFLYPRRRVRDVV